MKQLLIATLFVSLALPIACTRGTDTTTQAARESERMTDSQLQDRIETSLNSDPQLRDAKLSVSADADENNATLSGTVESEALRTRAVEMARAAHPGLVIQDKIDVKPRELSRSDYTAENARTEQERARSRKDTVGSSIDDAWIHSKIVAKLIGDTDTPEHKINVDVNNNTVTLRGTVDTAQEKQEAERIAKETDGVKRVNNMLKVAPTR